MNLRYPFAVLFHFDTKRKALSHEASLVSAIKYAHLLNQGTDSNLYDIKTWIEGLLSGRDRERAEAANEL